jgi:hypothetical protein
MAGGSVDGGAGDYAYFPEAIGLMPSAARKPDGSPAVAFYDRRRGNLLYAERPATSSTWSTPSILDGEGPGFVDTGDVGLYPSLAFDASGVGHVSYVDATRDNLLYVTTADKLPEVVDNGYRPNDELTLDNLAAPVFHLVGDSSSIQVTSGLVVIAYQDSTVLELRVAKKGDKGSWSHDRLAGHADPFAGSYGFYANLRVAGSQGVISSYAVDQSVDPPQFFVEVFALDLGLIK